MKKISKNSDVELMVEFMQSITLENTCVEKEMQSNIYSNLVSTVGQEKVNQVVFKTCTQYSKLRPTNIIQFLGIYNPKQSGIPLPAIVMEMMSYNLSAFVDSYENIPVHIKYSIVHDVSNPKAAHL